MSFCMYYRNEFRVSFKESLYFIILTILNNTTTAVDKFDLNSKFVDFGLNFLDLMLKQNQKFNNLSTLQKQVLYA